MSSQPSVLIIGAGPTGMTAAMELSRLGIPVRIIEKAAKPATTSRAIGVQARTLELFEQRGIVQPMLDKGNPGLGGSIYGEGKRIFRLEFKNNGSRYDCMFFISQADTEGILRDQLQKQGVTIEREVEFIALAEVEHSDTVTAVLKHKDGTTEEVRVPYLIDSEGAHSLARTTLGLQFKGKTREEKYALADLYVDGDLPSTDFHIFSSVHGFMGMFPIGVGHFRLIASNPLGEGKDAPSLEDIQAIYDQRSHIPARFHDMSWSSWFRINSRMVDHLRVGRIFLGGDSAHIHSPAGAQGMNTGIQDMINLSWKLAYVLKGEADPSLLDTYNDDRLPVIKNVLEKTEGLTDVIGNENQLFRSVFAYIAPWIVSTELVQQNATERMSQLSLNYRDSAISETHGSGSIHAGDRIPNPKVQVTGGAGQAAQTPHESDLYASLSTDRFTLLFTNLQNAKATHTAVQSKLAPWKPLLQTASIAPASGEEKHFNTLFGSGPGLVLIRPDGYAALTASASDIDTLAAWFEKWFPQNKAAAKQDEKEHAHA